MLGHSTSNVTWLGARKALIGLSERGILRPHGPRTMTQPQWRTGIPAEMRDQETRSTTDREWPTKKVG